MYPGLLGVRVVLKVDRQLVSSGVRVMHGFTDTLPLVVGESRGRRTVRSAAKTTANHNRNKCFICMLVCSG